MSDVTLWWDHPLAVVDVETTGLDPTKDRVIEIAVIQMRGGEVEGTWSSLVNPGIEIPPEVVNITGITQDDLKDAPSFDKIASDLLAHLDGRAFVAYNLSFDRGFIQTELERLNQSWPDLQCIDPLIFVRTLHRNAGSKRLSAVAARLGVTLDDAHRAAADAEATGRVLYKLADDLPRSLEELLLLQAQWEEQQQHEMAGWRGRRREPSAISAPVGAVSADRGNALGPAYVYGEDTDPVRAMFTHLPDSGSRR